MDALAEATSHALDEVCDHDEKLRRFDGLGEMHVETGPKRCGPVFASREGGERDGGDAGGVLRQSSYALSRA
jgi:hypothetical protein